MSAPLRFTKAHEGRPMEFLGFDGKQYHGRIVAIARRRWLVFTYFVFGTGEVTARLDLKVHRDRVLEVW
jgi:hypothetical protein